MKNKLTIVFMFLMTLTASAQTSIYHPFPDSNATWCDYAAYNISGQNYETYATHELNGQTIINGIMYNRLLQFIWLPSGAIDTTTLYIRQDIVLKKVWIYFPSTNSETILYNFDLQIGDTTYFNPPDYWIVSSIDSILINGNYRKRFYYSPTFAPTCFSSMIEGIGADHGLLFSPQNCFEYFGALIAFYQDGTCLYGDSIYPYCHDFTSGITEIKIEKTISISPNPFHSSAQLEFNSDFENAELKIYNTVGVQVRWQKIISRTTTINRDGLQDGIYFYQIIKHGRNLTSGKFVVE